MKGKSFILFLSVLCVAGFWCMSAFAISDSLVINKVFYRPTDFSTNGQWIELYNNSDNDIDLTNVNVVIQGATANDWYGPIQINLSAEVDAANSVIKAHNSFLISNTVTVSIGTESVTPNLYHDGVLAYLPNTYQDEDGMVRGVRVLMDGVVVDSVLYGIQPEEGEPSNPNELDDSEFYAGSEPDNETPTVEDTARGWGLVRITNASSEPVDTDETPTSDWQHALQEDMDPTAGPQVTPSDPPVAALYSCIVDSTSCMVAWECSNYDSYQIYWRNASSPAWNQIDGAAVGDITVDSGTGLIMFEDFNLDPDMPTGDFSAIETRMYKLVLIKN